MLNGNGDSKYSCFLSQGKACTLSPLHMMITIRYQYWSFGTCSRGSPGIEDWRGWSEDRNWDAAFKEEDTWCHCHLSINDASCWILCTYKLVMIFQEHDTDDQASEILILSSERKFRNASWTVTTGCKSYYQVRAAPKSGWAGSTGANNLPWEARDCSQYLLANVTPDDQGDKRRECGVCVFIHNLGTILHRVPWEACANASSISGKPRGPITCLWPALRCHHQVTCRCNAIKAELAHSAWSCFRLTFPTSPPYEHHFILPYLLQKIAA